jgi:hypothetical protein
VSLEKPVVPEPPNSETRTSFALGSWLRTHGTNCLCVSSRSRRGSGIFVPL